MTTCGKRTKRSEKPSLTNKVDGGKSNVPSIATIPSAANKVKTSDKKRKFDNVDFATKRIKLKVTFSYLFGCVFLLH